MTRALVVDDSRFMRTVIGNALGDAGYEVETAANGSEAVALASTFDPDVITMDVEMPELDGIDAVERIMTTNPAPILMLSVYTERGAEATLDALERGAVDFLHKPDGSDSRTIVQLTDEVVTKVDDLADANVSTVALARATATAHATRSRVAGNPRPGQGTTTGNAVAGGSGDVQVSGDHGPAGPNARSAIESLSEADEDTASLPAERTTAPTIVLGASTGGPKIVERLFEQLPADLEAKVLVVQHMPPGFTERSLTGSMPTAHTTSSRRPTASGSSPATSQSHRVTPISRLPPRSTTVSACDSATASESTAYDRRST